MKSLVELLSENPLMIVSKALSTFEIGIRGRINHKIFTKDENYVLTPAIMGAFNNTQRELFKETDLFNRYFRRYKGESLENKSILIWRSGGIGDLMFIQPLVKYIRGRWPTANIAMGTAPQNVEVISLWPEGLVDEMFTLPFNAKKMKDFDYHLVFEGVIERCKDAHTINCYELFQKTAGLEFDLNEYPIEILPNLDCVKDVEALVPKNTVSLQLRSTSPIRSVPFEGTKFLLEEGTKYFNFGIIDSTNRSMDIDALCSNRIFNFAKYAPNLSYATAFLSLSDAVIAVDSSMVHLGAALKKPVIGIYGPFRGELRMKYYKTGVWVEPKTECPKHPCFAHSKELADCPYIQNNVPPACMVQIDYKEVLDKCISLLKT